MRYIKFILASVLLLVLTVGLYSVFSSKPEKVLNESVLTPAAETENLDEKTTTDSTTTVSTKTAATPAPTSAQAKVLETVGIDSETVSFSQAEIACFKEVLGEARVTEILAGAVPGPVELYKAKNCLE